MNPFKPSNQRPRRASRNHAANTCLNEAPAENPKSNKKAKPKKNSNVNKNQAKVQEKDRERKTNQRLKLKENPQKYKEYLKKERLIKKKAAEEGKIKLVKDMNQREARLHRKKVRERVRKHRMKNMSADSPLKHVQKNSK